MEVLLVGPVMPRGRAGSRLSAAAKALGRSSARVIAVDGGLDACARLGLRPELAVGDWDSLRRRSLLERLPESARLTLSRDKDRSDLHHALRALGRALRGAPAAAARVTLMGFTGARADHHLAALLELHAYARRPHRAVSSLRLVGADEEYHWVSPAWGPWRATLARGTCVSVFSLSGRAAGVTLEGFEYGMTAGALGASSQGLSNRVRSRSCEIRVRSGALLVVLPGLLR